MIDHRSRQHRISRSIFPSIVRAAHEAARHDTGLLVIHEESSSAVFPSSLQISPNTAPPNLLIRSHVGRARTWFDSMSIIIISFGVMSMYAEDALVSPRLHSVRELDRLSSRHVEGDLKFVCWKLCHLFDACLKGWWTPVPKI
ncbi:uncharacterized protein MYCFIDRAFT_177864 [Pseudocercospora fijiensis CIRAD86]|uniref:Uncharacterized protein n=1 Tax=Pseudocercospora fijiensis (strain CIRAD86) TaxID=383855 RepID=M2ZJG7_PSEFD|nr:uncharacterized protein MYCFIDRAFT_177864 [Pseudocercospora fijiensis CIRAD86]EME79229.1 hypothetical protein MYCFIDRAFT_177864 [Pseudocercospora fijiensis CIRAD86]